MLAIRQEAAAMAFAASHTIQNMSLSANWQSRHFAPVCNLSVGFDGVGMPNVDKAARAYLLADGLPHRKRSHATMLRARPLGGWGLSWGRQAQ